MTLNEDFSLNAGRLDIHFSVYRSLCRPSCCFRALCHGETSLIPAALNEGVTLADAIQHGGSALPKRFDAEKFNMSSYSTESVAVASPYDTQDMRWVNYFPTWAEWGVSGTLGCDSKAAERVEKMFSMTTCHKPMYGKCAWLPRYHQR